MDEELDIENADILAVFGISSDHVLYDFFDNYMDTDNVIQALARAELSWVEFTKIKASKYTKYDEYMKLLDDYSISKIETNLKAIAGTGSFKHVEMVLAEKSEIYGKDKEEEKGPDVHDTLAQMIIDNRVDDEES